MIGRALMLLAGLSMVAFPMWGEPALAAGWPLDYLIIPGTEFYGDHPLAPSECSMIHVFCAPIWGIEQPVW